MQGTNMRLSNKLILILFLLLFLLVIDASVAFHIRDHGWFRYIATTDSGEVRVMHAPVTWVSVVIAIVGVLLHVVLIRAAWRAWRSAGGEATARH